jgi:hypothetical protein
MANHATNSLLDLCRFGISLKNEQTDTAARELSSYIVANSLMDHQTSLPAILEERVALLNDAIADQAAGTGRYPVDIIEEEEAEEPTPPDNGPMVA